MLGEPVGYTPALTWLRIRAGTYVKTAWLIVWAAVRHLGKAGSIVVWNTGAVTYECDARFGCASCGKSMTYREVKPQLRAKCAPGSRIFYRCQVCAESGVPLPDMRPRWVSGSSPADS